MALISVDAVMESLDLTTPQPKLITDATEFRPLDDNRLFVELDGSEYIIDSDVVISFSQMLKIPGSYASKLPPELLIDHWRYWIDINGSSFKAWVVNNKVVGIGSERATFIEPREILSTLSSVIDGNVYVFSMQTTYNDVGFKVVSIDNEVSLFDHDVFFPGLYFNYSPTGRKPLSLEGFTVREVCTNGMLDTETVEKLRRNVVPDDPIAWIYDAASVVWDETFNIFDRIRSAGEVVVPRGHVAEVLNDLFIQHRIPTVLRSEIYSSVLDDPSSEFTMMDIINHITAVASHSPELSESQRNRLFRTASLALEHQHICDTCYRPLP